MSDGPAGFRDYAETGPATVPNGWGAVGLALCYVPVQPGKRMHLGERG
jgi:hypothetical protein